MIGTVEAVRQGESFVELVVSFGLTADLKFASGDRVSVGSPETDLAADCLDGCNPIAFAERILSLSHKSIEMLGFGHAGDAGLHIMLTLYIADCQGMTLTFGCLVQRLNLSSNVALRYCDVLMKQGLLESISSSCMAQPRVFKLTAEGLDALHKIISAD
jgi:predicted transcriptional regulator